MPLRWEAADVRGAIFALLLSVTGLSGLLGVIFAFFMKRLASLRAFGVATVIGVLTLFLALSLSSVGWCQILICFLIILISIYILEKKSYKTIKE